MKATLVLDNGVRLSAPLSEEDAMALLEEFLGRLNCGAVPRRKSCKEEKPPDAKPAVSTGYAGETKLLAFRCAGCNGFRVIKIPKDTGIGDVVTCRCGHETQISGIKKATGDCANCGTKFFNLPVANGLLEVQCRDCKSRVDLTEKADGSLTGSHNLKY